MAFCDVFFLPICHCSLDYDFHCCWLGIWMLNMISKCAIFHSGHFESFRHTIPLFPLLWRRRQHSNDGVKSFTHYKLCWLIYTSHNLIVSLALVIFFFHFYSVYADVAPFVCHSAFNCLSNKNIWHGVSIVSMTALSIMHFDFVFLFLCDTKQLNHIYTASAKCLILISFFSPYKME